MYIRDGLAVGYVTNTPANDMVSVGDSNFFMYLESASSALIGYDDGDYLQYDRTNNYYNWNIAETLEMRLEAGGAVFAIDNVRQVVRFDLEEPDG